MARTPDDDIFLRELPTDGRALGNYRLIETLGWPEERYWRVRDRLIDEGRIAIGRGRGGTVRLLPQNGESAPALGVPSAAVGLPSAGPTSVLVPEKEVDLYPPLAETLRHQWKNERRLDNFLVEVTGQQGRRATGGVWTRPDLTGISVRRFAYVPGVHFDVWTFEVKPSWETNVIGVFEAAAHSRFATRSYVLYHVTKLDEVSDELETCIEEARRFGIGFVAFSDPSDFKTWEVHVDADRREPDPEMLDEFIATQIPDSAKHELQRWLR